MITAKFDTTSKLHLKFPEKNKPEQIVDAIRAFVDYELSRPVELQLPHTPIMVNLLQQWAATDDQRTQGEWQRANAAEAIERLDQEIVELVRHIRKTLDAAFPTRPSQAKGWGFKSKQTTKNILLPQSRTEHLMTLDKYIAQEQSRPAAERFTSPDLAEVIRVRDTMREQLYIRRIGRNQREKSVAAGNRIAAAMYNYLQAAAVHLLTFNFDFTITPKLEYWGYNVVSRRVASTKDVVEAGAAKTTSAPETTAEADASDDAPTNSAYTNGSISELLDLIAPDV